jgi:elongation factor Ts
MATLEQIKEVRTRSGVGMDACRKALEESAGDVEKALELLQKRGMVKATERAGRIATEGKVVTYVHGGGAKVAVVEVNCETDFSARTSEFQAFCDEVAMHIVAAAPRFLSKEEVPGDVHHSQHAIFAEQIPTGKPEAATAKILQGKFSKWYQEVCLLDQESVVQPGKTIDQLRTELGAKIGENVTIRRFIRWEVGEGLGS